MSTSTNPGGRLAAYRGTGLSPTVKALGATSFFQDVASEMVYPLLPTFLLALGGGAVALGVMESLAEGTLAVVKGLAGRWSDRRGLRKPFVSAGYGLSTLSRPLMAVAAAVGHLVVLRIVDRLAKGLRTAPRDAMIAEATPAADHGFAFSFHRGLDHLGAALGPLIAALVLALAPGRLRWVFALATLPALAGWATVQLRVRETAGDDRGDRAGVAPPAVAPAARLRVPPRLRLPLAAFFLFSLGNASDAFLLLRASDAGYSVLGLTLLWSGFHVAKWLASAPAGRLADRLGAHRPILVGWGLYALVYLGFGLAPGGPLGVAALFAVYALYYGLTEGAERSLVVRLAGGELGTGTSLGAFHLVTGLGTFFSSLLFGVLWQVGSPTAAFATGAALAGAASLLLARTVPPQAASGRR